MPILAILWATSLIAAPPTLDIPAEVKATPGQWVTISPKTDAVSVVYVSLDGLAPFPNAELKDARKLIAFVSVADKDKIFRFVAVGSSATGEQLTVPFSILTGAAPAPPPKPVDPDVKPVDPVVPIPAKTFRVIFVVESGDRLTTAQQGVIYGIEIENWAIKNCTGGKEGLRRRDQNNPTLSGEMQKIWTAAQPDIKKTPCVVVQADSAITIIDVEDTPAKMTAVLQSYLEGKKGK